MAYRRYRPYRRNYARNGYKRRKLFDFISPIGGAISTALSNRFANSFSQTRTRRSNTKGIGVTNQYDAKLIYHRKRMPRYKKRRWVKAVKRYRAIEMKSLGTKTVVFNDEITSTPGTVIAGTNQFLANAALFGKNGRVDTTSICGQRDLRTICNNDADIDEWAEKFQLMSGIIDFTVTNSGNPKIELDIYTVFCYGDATGVSYQEDLQAAANNTGAIAPAVGSNTSLAITDRGVTPFEFPLLSKMGYKIVAKKKYFLNSGDVCTFQYRDARNHLVDSINVLKTENESENAYKNLTKQFLFIAKAVPGSFIDAENIPEMTIGVTRKYAYKVIKDNKDNDASY